ncbi:MAG: protein-methionine-sulfoxide reductase catalytic subunit MsrP [Comamonadaceae bacterium]|nr:protein-methionine-sulfoxide reductase catalytic subunit MsrP [Comamonadaceae bacterium]
MLIRCKHSGEPAPSEITDESLRLNRREFLKFWASQSLMALAAAPAIAAVDESADSDFRFLRPSDYSTDEEQTRLRDIARYNNFYEFGTAKTDSGTCASTLQVQPWTLMVDGEVHQARRFDIDELLRFEALEERIYRLRCVEGWSMVIPWVGFPLKTVIDRVDPKGSAKYVEFTTLHDPLQMPGQRSAVLDWPYVEGLRLDEAMHPLTILAVGVYGKLLPKQNGAPMRLVVPWKYGFKSIKSIVRIRLLEQPPLTSWMKASHGNMVFFANVNPEVDHPRWTQSKERRIGEFFKRPTLKFNGYGDQVAHLYSGMDLQAYF